MFCPMIDIKLMILKKNELCTSIRPRNILGFLYVVLYQPKISAYQIYCPNIY